MTSHPSTNKSGHPERSEGTVFFTLDAMLSGIEQQMLRFAQHDPIIAES
jgi:hypothetical protein